MRAIVFAVCLACVPAFAHANGFEPIRDKGRFLSLIDGKELRIGLYNLTLKVLPDGRISGTALGWGITGKWNWENGYFCRDMDWSGYAIPRNCQLVEANGDRELRFTVDQGRGKSASFRLR
ncbi:MAG: dihydrodipicolinate reductase [Rhodobacteraceae bacterium]|nr:dihydrodipicolinate reductase [Paracoccaceae bacterium]